MKESPLTLIARMANKCRELFRRAGHPGWALFAEVASDAVATKMHTTRPNNTRLTESIDDLLRKQGYNMPLLPYLFTRAGLRDLATGTALALAAFGISFLLVSFYQL